jgi:hypothetical protein
MKTLKNYKSIYSTFPRNVHGITSTTGAGLLFVFKACPVFITGAPQQAHSELCNCCGNAEDGQQDKSVVEVISCTFLKERGFNNFWKFDVEFWFHRSANKIGAW